MQGESDPESSQDAVVLSEARRVVPKPGNPAGTCSVAVGRASLNGSCCASPGFIESCLDFTVFTTNTVQVLARMSWRSTLFPLWVEECKSWVS